jgi:hypothetical protein
MPGDVIVAVDNNPILKGTDLATRIGSMLPGTSAAIGRDGDERTTVRLGQLSVTPFKAAAEPQSQQPAHLGLTLAPATSIKGVGAAGVAIVETDARGREDNESLNVAENRPVKS